MAGLRTKREAPKPQADVVLDTPVEWSGYALVVRRGGEGLIGAIRPNQIAGVPFLWIACCTACRSPHCGCMIPVADIEGIHPLDEAAHDDTVYWAFASHRPFPMSRPTARSGE